MISPNILILGITVQSIAYSITVCIWTLRHKQKPQYLYIPAMQTKGACMECGEKDGPNLYIPLPEQKRILCPSCLEKQNPMISI